MAKRGHFYPDISSEFEIARLNYGLANGDDKLKLKDFHQVLDGDDEFSSALISNIVAGRTSHRELRQQIEDFTERWYWNYNKKTAKPDE